MSLEVRAESTDSGQLLRLVLDAPKGNVLSMARMEAISAALAAHRDDPRLKLVVWTAEGPHFSFGAAVEEHEASRAPAMLKAFHAFVRDLASYPVPIAPVVHGKCLGGAFEAVLACHFVFATPSARFACPEVKLGVFPPVLAAIGAARLGHALAERMVVTGAEIDANDAQRAGMLAELVAASDAVEHVLAWAARELFPLSAFTVRQATKAARRASGLLELLGAPLDRAEAQYVGELLTSHDGNEGIAAFLAKRAPAWKDR